MEMQCDFDRELTFDEAVFDDRALPFLNRIFALANFRGLLVGAHGEVLDMKGFPASNVNLPDFEKQGLPGKPATYPSSNGEKFVGRPVHHEGEPFALLVVQHSSENGDPDMARRIHILIEILESYFELKHNQRMISEVHHSALEINYQELLKKNKEIKASEQRYRELAQNLEIRVEERKKELEQAQQQLVHQEKMACIGQLAAGVAHEINNPNGFIHSNLSTLKTYHKQISQMLEGFWKASRGQSIISEKLERRWKELDMDYILSDLGILVDQCLSGTDRITKIVKGLSCFSHLDKNEIELFDMNALIENNVELLQNEIKHKAELIKDFQDLPRVTGLPGQLTQVFVNLIVNALQSMEDYGRLVIRTRWEDDRVKVSFKDNGVGIDSKHISRLFDPFFTTKPVGKGTGLGLSISYEIIKNHGGDINVTSAPGQGSTFTISLPRDGIEKEYQI